MGGPEPYPCGTKAAYSRHIRRGEKPCPDCIAANRVHSREQYHADIERSRRSARTWQAAVRILRREHPDEWRALFDRFVETRRAEDPDARYAVIRSRAVSDANLALRRTYPTDHVVILSALRTTEKGTDPT